MAAGFQLNVRLHTLRTWLWAGAAALLVGLLALLATLQFRWIDAVITAERERMQAHVQAAASRMTQEFDRELMRVCATFLVAPFEWREGHWRQVGEHFRVWSQTATYPKLVRNVYVMSQHAGDRGELHRFDPAGGELEATPWPSQFAALRQRLESRGEQSAMVPGLGPRPVQWTIEEQPPALVLIVNANAQGQSASGSRPSVMGALIVELNGEYMRDELLPNLARKHFPASAGFDYDTAVVSARDAARFVYRSPGSKESTFRAPDQAMPMFALRAADANTFTPMLAFARPGSAVRGKGNGRGPSAGAPSFRGRGLAVQSIQGGMDAKWRLVAKHRSGSLETAVESLRRRHLAIGFATLLLLGLSVGLIFMLTRRAQQLAKAQSEFLAGISHELLTPLAVIRSAADNLADGVALSGERAQQYGEMIRRQSRRLSEMMQDALGFAVAQNVARERFRTVAIGELIRRAVETCRPAIVESGVELTQEIDPDLPAVLGEATALSHALRNLIMNGLQYGGDGGWLAIRAHRARGKTGEAVEIEVADKGPGIDPVDLPHLFEPFYRGGNAARVRLHGTGLGLSLVKRIADDHGGEVHVRSRRPGGTVFTLRLPAAPVGGVQG